MVSIIDTLSVKYHSVRLQTVKICQPLQTEDYVVQPIVDVSPPKWHLAHTTWFFENFILKPYQKGYQVFDKDFDYLFNSYYETMGERVLRPNRGFMTRPGVEEIMKYRAYVDKHMADFLVSPQNITDEIAHILELGVQHEQQHQELLVYDIKYILGTNPVFPSYLKKDNSSITNTTITEPSFVCFEEGLYDIGFNGEGFCFDNELGSHKVYLHAFQVMDRLVTNREYLTFIQEGGYNQFEHWLAEGWDWVNEKQIKAPLHWHQIDGQWYYYQLRGGLQELGLNEPVTHINYYEANAYARWKGMRLATEFEWEVASHNGLLNSLNDANFVEKSHFGPVAQSNGSSQFYGDTWEWTQSPYTPYPYYKSASGALGEYNGKFMVNQMVLRGGSCATPKNHIRTTYRNFFHPHLRWHFTGIRLAESI